MGDVYLFYWHVTKSGPLFSDNYVIENELLDRSKP